MAEKPSNPGAISKDFDDFLKSCPDADEPAEAAPLRVAGVILRTRSADSFALMATDGSRIDLPRAAVTGFTALSGGNGGRMAELTLDRARLGEDLIGKLGAIKIPFEKAPPFDTLKELPGDGTLKEGPWDTLKEAGGGDTLKEQPFDTLKELGGGDTLKEGPWDTLKETGGGDTLKEQPFDTLKEGPFDTLKEFGGEGTGVADTLVEGIGQPGGEVINPAMQTRMAGGPAGGAAAAGLQAALKPLMRDTIKEAAFDHTLKEIISDPKYIKEIVKEVAKEVAWEGTGAADTLVEGIPDWGSIVTNPAVLQAAGAVPFVLATPHQAPQGAIAQQMLAAQAMAGRLGF